MRNLKGTDHAPLAVSLAKRLHDQGAPEHIARLFVRVPRHRFLPDVYWTADRARVDRTTDPETWLRTAYTDQALTTQRDDGAQGGMGVPSSSSSAPSVMARMLTAAKIGPGHRVLEIGTGTGWNAALLSELLGSRNVSTIEIDPAVADHARLALYTSGYGPDVVIGDGENAQTRHMDYHRIIATCTVSQVPWRWLEQASGQGRIITPWSPTPGAPGGGLAALDSLTSTRVEGRFEGGLSFMWSRNQRWPGQPAPSPEARAEHTEIVDGDPRETWLDGEKALLLALMRPGWTFGMRMESDTEPYVWLASTTCESWARLHADGRVEQGGRRLLVEEARTTWQWWATHGKPQVSDFGLTVDRDRGCQTVWLHEPQHAVWSTHRQI